MSGNLDEYAAKFVLGLREKCGVKDNAVTESITDTKDLIKRSLEDFASKVQKSLQKIMDVNCEIRSISQMFDDVKSVYRQNKVFSERVGVVHPVKIPLGRELKRVRRKGEPVRKTVLVLEELVFVPLEGTVCKLLNHPDYKYFVENRDCSINSSFLDSYMKGTLSQHNKVLKEHPDALRFVLYYDDLEVCSPLKSRAGKRKLGAFYFYLDNIPSKFRSNLASICLLALVNANLIKTSKYGIDSVLDKIVEDIKRFENGVILPNGMQVYGTLIAAIGDNLGLHALGGFKGGFTAHRPCRFCLVTYDELQTLTIEKESLLRDEVSHTEHVEKIQTTRGKNTALSTTYGVNRDSKLNELQSFHVTKNLPSDLTHDVLEGVLPLTIKRLLKHLIYSKKTFTLEWLNKTIKDFDFDYSELADKPSEISFAHISDEGSIHQSACQMWLLASVLPLILGPFLFVKDKHWSNFLDLLEICRIVFTESIMLWMVSYLKDLIKVFLNDTIELYSHITPKFHHMTHYPNQILQFGSLVNFMCLRCEAKHKNFKQLVNSLGNFKNIPWTLAEKHQMNQGYNWARYLRKHGTCGPQATVDVSDDPLLKSLLPPSLNTVVETKWLDMNGLKFVPERCFVVVGCNSEDLPVFAKVMRVFVHPDVRFICNEVKTVAVNVNCSSFIVEVLENPVVLKPQDFLVHAICHGHFVQGNINIFSKTCLGNCL